MNATTLLHRARQLAALAGTMDFLTGAGLVALPAFTLRLMRAEVPGAEALVFVRFVGAFVGAVGASYLWCAAAGGARRLRVLFELTVILRGAAGSFTGVAVALGALGPAWLAVTLTDLTLAGLQVWWLRQEVGRDA